jgi:LPS sulfotransferase NodH
MTGEGPVSACGAGPSSVQGAGSGMDWTVTTMDRRLDFADFLGPAFDSAGQACARRIFLFATPRSVSWTACRYLTAAGWGIACEYFGDHVIELSQRLMGLPRGASLRHEDLGRYRLALEDSRSRNGIFSSKVFWQEFRRLNRAYPEGMLQSASHLFLHRRDFAAQVVSMAVGMQSLRLSFSDQALDIGNVRLQKADDADVLRRCAESLMRAEHGWFAEFRRRGWRPHLIEAEALLAAPAQVCAGLAARLELPFDEANVLRCHGFEQDARYAPGASVKRQLETDHADLLADYAARRAAQFAREGADVLAM